MPDEAVRKTALKVVQRNAFFAHQENVLIAMLGDNDEEIRMRGVNKVLTIRGNLPSTVSFDNHDLVDSRSEEYSLEGAKYYDTASTVRLFEPPTLDLTVNSYYKMVNLTSCHQQPPVIEHLTDLDIERTMPDKTTAARPPMSQPMCRAPCQNGNRGRSTS